MDTLNAPSKDKKSNSCVKNFKCSHDREVARKTHYSRRIKIHMMNKLLILYVSCKHELLVKSSIEAFMEAVALRKKSCSSFSFSLSIALY